MKRKIIEISISLGLIIAIVFSLASFNGKCDKIRNEVLRLHILANSDSDEDQCVKLLVRDALLNSGKEIFSGAANVKNAEESLKAQKRELVEKANRVLAENGFDYEAKIYLAEEFFTTRQYENFTLPAGEYLALKVILGKGEGHNWWCVMYPPLCIPAASEDVELDVVLGDDGAKIINSGKKYIMKFKIIEIIERIKARKE